MTYSSYDFSTFVGGLANFEVAWREKDRVWGSPDLIVDILDCSISKL